MKGIRARVELTQAGTVDEKERKQERESVHYCPTSGLD